MLRIVAFQTHDSVHIQHRIQVSSAVSFIVILLVTPPPRWTVSVGPQRGWRHGLCGLGEQASQVGIGLLSNKKVVLCMRCMLTLIMTDIFRSALYYWKAGEFSELSFEYNIIARTVLG